MQTWHDILGHCNYNDIQKLWEVVNGMTIEGNLDKSVLTLVLSVYPVKFVQMCNREPDVGAKIALQLVHTDLAGPKSKDVYRFALSFTDDYSSMIFAYFLKKKKKKE